MDNEFISYVSYKDDKQLYRLWKHGDRYWMTYINTLESGASFDKIILDAFLAEGAIVYVSEKYAKLLYL